MMLKRALFLLLLLYCGYTNAQDIDSVTLVNATWKKQKIAPKVKLITHHFDQKNLFLANQNISYVEVKNKGAFPFFDIGYEEKEVKKTDVFGIENNALVALNGTFFDIKNGGSVDFIKVNGKIINPNRLEKGNKRARHQEAAVVIANGKLDIKKYDGTDKWEENLKEEDVMLSGPLLILNQKNQVLDTAAFNRLATPEVQLALSQMARSSC